MIIVKILADLGDAKSAYAKAILLMSTANVWNNNRRDLA